MALTNVEILRAIMPNIGLPVNPDGTYRIGVEDVNSDEILAAAAALVVDLAAIEIINTAIQVATEASAVDLAALEVLVTAGNVDLAAIEVINTAIQTAVQGMQAVDGAVGVAADVDGVRQGQLRYIGEQAALILAAVVAGGPMTIADGADVTQGAIADAVVAAGAAGTLSAKLRRLTTDLNAGIVDLAAIEVINTAIQTAVEIMDDWDEANRAKVNPIAGQAGIAANAGAMDALTTRITLATDDTHMGAVGVAAAVAGTLHAQQRYIGDQLALILAAVAAAAVGDYATATHTWPVIANATTVALAANANRLYACFVNDGTEPIYLYLGAAAVMNRGIRLNVGGSYEMSREIGNLYVGAINGICATGGMTLLVTEGV